MDKKELGLRAGGVALLLFTGCSRTVDTERNCTEGEIFAKTTAPISLEDGFTIPVGTRVCLDIEECTMDGENIPSGLCQENTLIKVWTPIE